MIDRNKYTDPFWYFLLAPCRRIWSNCLTPSFFESFTSFYQSSLFHWSRLIYSGSKWSLSVLCNASSFVRQQATKLREGDHYSPQAQGRQWFWSVSIKATFDFLPSAWYLSDQRLTAVVHGESLVSHQFYHLPWIFYHRPRASSQPSPYLDWRYLCLILKCPT